MKKRLNALLLLLASIMFAQSILHKTLPNGMEVVVKENKNNTDVGLYCFVKTGSDDEDEYTGKGISHYVEHIVNGGSTKNHSEKWFLEKENEIGASSSAYTTSYCTTYCITSDKQYSDISLSMLADHVMNCSFNKKEIKREKEVIIKEFLMRASPMEEIGTALANSIYYHIPFPTNVIGDIGLFKETTRDELIAYYNRRYVPNNMIFVAVGDLDPHVMMKNIEETFKDYKKGTLAPVFHPEEKIHKGNVKYIEEFAIEQSIGHMIKFIPTSKPEDITALSMAAKILLGKRSSPVQYKIVEEEKLANSVSGFFGDGYLQPKCLYIDFEMKESNKMDIVVKRIDDIIAETVEEGITQKQIDEVITAMKAQRILQPSDIVAEAESIGDNMIAYGIPEIYEIEMAQYKALTPEKVTEAIKEFFLPDNRILFYAVPEGQKQIVENKNKIEIIKTDAEKIAVNDSLILLHKRNTTLPVINGQIFLPISSDYETIENAGLLQFMLGNMSCGGTEDYTSMELSSWYEIHATNITLRITVDGIYISFRCLKDDIDELLKRLFSIINKPVFDEKEFSRAKERQEADYQKGISDQSREYREFRKSVLFKGKRDGLTDKEKNEIIQNATREDLMNLHKNYFLADDILVSLFGDITRQEAIQYAEKISNNIPKGKIEGEKTPVVIPKLNETYINECEFEQVLILFNFQAPFQNDPEYYAMTVLNRIMTDGWTGRLQNATRIENDLTYGTDSGYYGEKNSGLFLIASFTSLENKDELVKVIKEEVEKIIDGDVTLEEIDKAVESYAKSIDGYSDDKLLEVMTLNESKGLGYNFHKECLTGLKKVTPEDIKAVANKYLKDAAVIISQPSKEVKRTFE